MPLAHCHVLKYIELTKLEFKKRNEDLIPAFFMLKSIDWIDKDKFNSFSFLKNKNRSIKDLIEFRA